MSSLKSPFRVRVSGDGTTPLTFVAGEHFKLCLSHPAYEASRELTARQVDLVRLGLAVHLADGWVKRFRANNGYRRPVVDVDLLDSCFWGRSDVAGRLKQTLDFLSGGDDWTIRPRPDTHTCHTRQPSLFKTADASTIVNLQSGGLDSAAGLALRLQEAPGRRVVPVTVRYQAQRGRVVNDQIAHLRDRGFARPGQIRPFQVGAFVKNTRLRRDFNVRLREISHRCKPFLFFSVAGLAAHVEGAGAVEVYESGIGAVNLPLVSGRPGWCTTRSTHPEFLRLMADLVNTVNGGAIRYTLPFRHMTKGEMAGGLARAGLASLARMTVSCITHPLRRGGNRRQCGTCPACVFRRQAMWRAGILEAADAYVADVFDGQPGEREARSLIAFRQQAARLAELDGPDVPAFFRRHLFSNRIVSTEGEMTPYLNLFRRYRDEWADLEREVRLPTPADYLPALVGGGTTP